MSLRRDRRRGQKKYRRTQQSVRIAAFAGGRCLNCGEPGPHFVPPSFGDEGFYMCVKRDTIS